MKSVREAEEDVKRSALAFEEALDRLEKKINNGVRIFQSARESSQRIAEKVVGNPKFFWGGAFALLLGSGVILTRRKQETGHRGPVS